MLRIQIVILLSSLIYFPDGEAANLSRSSLNAACPGRDNYVIMSYSEKLKDPRWQKKRLEILSRDNFTCRGCDETTKMLVVHHIGYGDGDPWDVDDDLLITFCEECHEEEELRLKEMTRRLISSLRGVGFMSLEMGCLSRVFKGSTRKWTYNEPAFSALKMAIDDDEIWNDILDKFWSKE